MAIPGNAISGKDKSTPIGLAEGGAQEDLDTIEVPGDQSAEGTSADAADESED
jgi:hypothetical protein